MLNMIYNKSTGLSSTKELILFCFIFAKISLRRHIICCDSYDTQTIDRIIICIYAQYISLMMIIIINQYYYLLPYLKELCSPLQFCVAKKVIKFYHLLSNLHWWSFVITECSFVKFLISDSIIQDRGKEKNNRKGAIARTKSIYFSVLILGK